jgi:hypothetical protein
VWGGVDCGCDVQSFCCLSFAVSANRARIQQQRGLINDCCDECILFTMCFCSCCLTIMNLFGMQIDPSVQNAVDLLYCSVVGCMLTQQSVEIEEERMSGPERASMK